MAVRVDYDDGYGVPEDKKEAAKWYRKAAEQGLALAQTNLGGCDRVTQTGPCDWLVWRLLLCG